MSSRKSPSSKTSAYSTKGKLAAVSAPASQQLAIYNARAWNNSGSSINVGIVRLLATPSWKLWTATTGGTVFTDVTAAVQAGTATAIFSGTNNDGFVVQSTHPVDFVGFTISTQQSGGTYTYQYANTATGFATLPTIEVPANYNTAADTWIVAQSPYDAALAGNASLNQTMYSMKVISTTAPAGAVSITNMWVGRFIDFYQGVANNSAVQIAFPDTRPFILHGSESLIPYFGTASNANAFGAFYVTQGD